MVVLSGGWELEQTSDKTDNAIIVMFIVTQKYSFLNQLII